MIVAEGAGGGVSNHTDLLDMPSAVNTDHDGRYYTEAEHINSSAGAGDSGKPIVLDADGDVDATMINSVDVDHDSTTNTHNLTTDINHNTITNNHNLTTDIDHNTITNNHNLTTDINHNTITNNHNLTTDIDHDTITNNHNLTTDIDHNTITNTHNLTTDIDHDQLTNYSAAEHIDWSLASQGTIDDTNIEDKFLRNDGDDVTTGSITAEEFIGYGVVPKGSILAWDKSDTGTPALPDGYQECNGQLDTDTDSIYYNQTVRSLNSGQNRYLRGNSTSGGTGGGTANHRHQLTLTGITAVAVASGGPAVNIVQAGNYYTHYTAPNINPKYMNVVWIRRCK